MSPPVRRQLVMASAAHWIELEFLNPDQHHGMPPDGTTIEGTFDHDIVAHPLLSDTAIGLEVLGVPTTGDPGDWWWISLADFLIQQGEDIAVIGPLLSTAFNAIPGREANVIGDWPVLFLGAGSTTMRWLQSTFRAALFGVEEAQFKIDWGMPGADPDLDEAGELAFAEVLADNWETEIVGNGLGSYFGSEVVWTEVGVSTQIQTSATDSHGEGGTHSQPHTTQWFPYVVGSEPKGVSTALSLPFEVSCCVSLLTAVRGARGRGRFYLPPFDVNRMTDGGLYGASSITNVVNQLANFITNVKAGSDWVPLVVSRRDMTLHEVTNVEVGHVPDSQRRRRRSQIEARAVAIL